MVTVYEDSAVVLTPPALRAVSRPIHQGEVQLPDYSFVDDRIAGLVAQGLPPTPCDEVLFVDLDGHGVNLTAEAVEHYLRIYGLTPAHHGYGCRYRGGAPDRKSLAWLGTPTIALSVEEYGFHHCLVHRFDGEVIRLILNNSRRLWPTEHYLFAAVRL